MISNRRILLFLSILCTAVCLAGCRSASDPDRPDAGGRTEEPLEYYIWSDEENYISKIVETYNSLKGREAVRIHIIPTEEQGDWINNFNEQVRCDILDMKGNDDLLKLTEKGALLSLNSFLADSDLDFSAYSGQIYDTEIEEQYYALPQRSTCWVLYYNKDILDQCGLSYPEQITWEELLLLAGEIEKNAEPEIYGCLVPDWTMNFAAIQQDEYLISDDLSRTTENLAYLQRLYSGAYGPDFAETHRTAMNSRYVFGQGRVGLMVNGEWMVNMLRQDEENNLPSVRWGIAPLPIPDERMEPVSFGMYQFSAISASCRDPQEGFEFLTFLCGKAGAAIMASNSMIPAYTTDEIINIYKKNTKIDNADIFFRSNRKEEQLMWKGYEKAVAAFREAVIRCAENEMPAEKSMNIFREDREKIYQ